MAGYTLGQLRGAWGAGFAAAEKKMQQDGELVGRYAHILDEGAINHQCKVIARHGERYEVQFFSWISGEPTIRKIVAIDDTREWIFYDNREEWLAAGEAVA